MLECTIKSINHNKITLNKKVVAKFHSEVLKIKLVETHACQANSAKKSAQYIVQKFFRERYY